MKTIIFTYIIAFISITCYAKWEYRRDADDMTDKVSYVLISENKKELSALRVNAYPEKLEKDGTIYGTWMVLLIDTDVHKINNKIIDNMFLRIDNKPAIEIVAMKINEMTLLLASKTELTKLNDGNDAKPSIPFIKDFKNAGKCKIQFSIDGFSKTKIFDISGWRTNIDKMKSDIRRTKPKNIEIVK